MGKYPLRCFMVCMALILISWARSSPCAAASNYSATPLIDTIPFRTDIYLYGKYTPMYPPKILGKHIGEHAYTQGKVFNDSIAPNNNLLLFIDGNSPNQAATIIIKRRNRLKFNQPETNLIGKTITVLGWVSAHKHKPEMVLSNPKQLQVSGDISKR
jgi:hypothetical protein